MPVFRIDDIFTDVVKKVSAEKITPADLCDEEYEALSKVVDAVLAQDPKNKIALTFKVKFLIEEENFEEALLLQRQIFEDDPNDLNNAITIGILLFKLDQFQEAHPYLSFGVTEFPKDEYLKATLGFCCFKLGNPTMARRYLQPLFESGDLNILGRARVTELLEHKIVASKPLTLTNAVNLSRL